MSRWVSSRADDIEELRYNAEHDDHGRFGAGSGKDEDGLSGKTTGADHAKARGVATVAHLSAGDSMQKTNMRTGKVETVKVLKVADGRSPMMREVTVKFKSGEEHTEQMHVDQKIDHAMSTKDALAAGAKGDAKALNSTKSYNHEGG